MDYNSYLEPLNRTSRTIHRSAREGAKRAQIDIHPDRIEFRDDRGLSATILTGAVDPDLLHTLDANIEAHVVPASLHVHVVNHAKGRRAIDETHQHLRNPEDHNPLPPRRTPNGRYWVYLTSRDMGPSLTVMNHDGTIAQQRHRATLDAKCTESSQPGAIVHRRAFPIIAMPDLSTNTTANGSDVDEITETAAEMLVLHMNQYKSQSGGGLMWPDIDSRRMLPAPTLRRMPERPQTCRWYDGQDKGYDEMLLPENAARPALSFTHGRTLKLALEQHPYPHQELALVSSRSEGLTEPSQPVLLPVIVITAVEVTENDGSITHLPVPRYDEQQRYPHPREKRLHHSRSGTAKAIEITLEYRANDQEPVPFTIPAHIYADQDEDDFVIITTPELGMTADEVEEASDIRHHYRPNLSMGPFDWFPEYQAHRAVQTEPNQANRHIAERIARSIEDMGVTALDGEDEVTVTSPSGNISITIRPAPQH